MAMSLERVISVHQTSKAATSLPLELMQHVFSYLDCRSFFAARKVCRYWEFASSDAVPLARQLKRLPILPAVSAADSNPVELQSLYDEAARALMLSVKSERKWDQPGTLSRALQMGFHITPRLVATPDGERTVTLNDRQITLFDTSGETPRCLAQRVLNDLKENLGNGPWLKTQPDHKMALSSSGTLLAIAQERTIQIYDLTAEPDSFTVNEYISSATGHYICGLDFEQADHVLRVRLSGKGTTLYLGSSPCMSTSVAQRAGIEHWKSKWGLSHTLLDSSLLTIPPTPTDADQAVRISGLQLLRSFEGGYLFAGQRHGGGESSYYILGHVKTSQPDNMVAAKVVCDSVVVLARLESFLSSFEHTLEFSNEGGLGLWENMPSAHEHHPRFAMTVGGAFVAVAERDKKRIRPAPLTQLFVYRVPSEQGLRALIAETETSRKEEWSTWARFHNKLDDHERKDFKEIKLPAKVPKYSIPRLPLCLSTVQGDIEHLSFTPLASKAFSLSAATVETTRSWRLDEW